MPSDNQGKILDMTQHDRCCGCNGSRVYCDGKVYVHGQRCCGWCDHHPHGTLDGRYGNGQRA